MYHRPRYLLSLGKGYCCCVGEVGLMMLLFSPESWHMCLCLQHVWGAGGGWRGLEKRRCKRRDLPSLVVAQCKEKKNTHPYVLL